MLITVKAARVNVGKSQKEVAGSLGLSLNAYVKKENGKRKFYVNEIVRLGEIFGVNISFFYETQCHKKTQVSHN